MVNQASARKYALSLPEATEEPHFEKTSFRVKKKIFATLDESTSIMCIKLNLIDQSAFTAFDKNVIYAVPNKWGAQGWTFVDLKKVKSETLRDALKTAYCTVAPKKLVEMLEQGA